MKTSAIDYLIEYINSKNEDKWLKSVVACYLSSNEEISEKDMQHLKEDLLANRSTEYLLNTSDSILDNSSLIKLKRLNHVSGVNALSNNQEIIFSDQVTVLYGLNGSGKSSYFRILQAMMGSIKKSEIIPNIYLENNHNLSVNLEYKIDSNTRNVSWNNNDTINDLKTIKVFDSKYSQKFLEKRESDEQVLYPYKLYVFSEVSNYIDKIKDLANTCLDQKMKDNVLPNMDKFNEKDKKIFEREMTRNDLEYFATIAADFNETKAKELIDKQKEINLLTETDYSVKLELIENKKQKYEDTKKRVESMLFLWKKKSEEYHQQVTLYEKDKKDSEEKRKQIQVLSNLPGTDSDEWKKFINMGLSISENSEDLKEICPYCYRKYDENALSIVQAYSVFIEDITSENLRMRESNLMKIINEAIHAQIIQTDYLFEEDKDLELSVTSLLKEVVKYLEKLQKMKGSIKNIEPINFDTTFIESKFIEIDKTYKTEKDVCSRESSEKEEKLIKLKKRESELISQKSIHEQFDVISKFIEYDINIRRLRQIVSGVTSHKISSISKKAHDELLSKQLMINFKTFLDKFNILDRGIELKASTTKGTQQTELVMNTKNHVTKILSEGEQKAVSIALFLAEIFVAQNKSTIILDDPVNSLDHRMMNCLSDILLQLDNQTIVFTHNRMFLDSISGSEYGHLCKNFITNGCNKNKGRHIFVYQIKSEGTNEKGVITSDIKNDAQGYLSNAKELLDKSPFDEELKVCALLRNAIDHIIDEVIFNRQAPRRYSIKGVSQSIQWEELKKMAPDSKMIDDLKGIFGRVSSGYLHVGQVSSNNPPDKEELLKLYDELVKMLTRSS